MKYKNPLGILLPPADKTTDRIVFICSAVSAICLGIVIGAILYMQLNPLNV